MDPLQAASRVLAAYAAGEDVRVFDAPGSSACHGMQRRRAAQAGELRVLDVVMKRNLVFASYAWCEADGREATGTWVLAMDREGRVLSWRDMS